MDSQQGVAPSLEGEQGSNNTPYKQECFEDILFLTLFIYTAFVD